MYIIKPLPNFIEWLDNLADEKTRGIISARIKRLERGLMGDVEPVGGRRFRIANSCWLRLASVFYKTRRKTDYFACWRFQKYTKKRHQTSPKADSPFGLTGVESMTKRIKIDDLPEFDAAPYLNSEEAVAAYLTDILEANDAGLLAAALGDIARARGMTEIAKSAGITREALYKALRSGSEPRFDTVNRVCSALGVRLVVQPIHPH